MGILEENSGNSPLCANIVDELSSELFVERWRELVGEPPAAMLASHRHMLMLLVESLPVKSLTPTGNLLPPSRYRSM